MFVTVPPLPDLLGGALPTLGWALAALAVPAVLLVDVLDKAWRAEFLDRPTDSVASEARRH